MVLGDDIDGLLVLAVVDQPSRGLGDHENKDELDQRGDTLQDRGNSPAPSVVDSESTKSGPSSNDRTEVPGRVVQRSDGSSMGGEGELGDKGRRGETGEGKTETDQESTTDKHADVLGSGLKSDADELDSRTEEHGPSSTESIVDKGGKGQSDDTTDRLDGIEETKGGTVGVVKVDSPSVEGSAVSNVAVVRFAFAH